MTNRAVEIPRGTCRLFGTIKALNTIKNTAIIVHGPKGCVYHINYILGLRGDRPSRVYSTSLDENDVIFGAEKKLINAIEELDDEYHPDLIIVLSCCASSIIGEDVDSAVRHAKSKAKVIGIESGGFEGDFRTGYSETLKKLVEELTLPSKTKKSLAVNLVGMLRGGPDLRELKRILSSIGVTVNAVLTADATLDQIQHVGAAALNIVLCEPSGKEAADILEKKFGIPYIIEDLPIGYSATVRFLEHVGHALGISLGAMDFKRNKEQTVVPIPYNSIAIISGPTRAIAMTQFLHELGINPRLVVIDFDSDLKSRLAEIVGPDCEILIEPEQEEIIEQLKEKSIDLIIGGMLERPIAAMVGIDYLDIMHGSQRTVGFEGADTLMDLLRSKRQKMK